jgi:hypothetical protein
MATKRFQARIAALVYFPHSPGVERRDDFRTVRAVLLAKEAVKGKEGAPSENLALGDGGPPSIRPGPPLRLARR